MSWSTGGGSASGKPSASGAAVDPSGPSTTPASPSVGAASANPVASPRTTPLSLLRSVGTQAVPPVAAPAQTRTKRAPRVRTELPDRHDRLVSAGRVPQD